MKLTSQQLARLATGFPFFLHFRGNYRQDLSINILEIVEANLSLHFSKSFVRKLSYLVIESIQNIVRYSESEGSSEDFCYVFSDKVCCHIITRNKISTLSLENLKTRLEEIKNKTQDELDETYLEILNSEQRTSKGAGLGLIDMARKTRNGIRYAFDQHNDDSWSYTLHLQLPVIDAEITMTDIPDYTDLINELNAAFAANKHTLLYSGDFSNSFLKTLLDMLNHLRASDHLPASSVFRYSLIELNQNIYRHALRLGGQVPGVLCMEWKEKGIQLTTYNFMEEKNRDILTDKLDRLNSSGEEALVEMSEDHISDFSTTGGLGLVDIARLNWPNPIEYDTAKIPNFGNSIRLSINIQS